MPFMCPQCGKVSMKITLSIELPPDARSDEIAVQITRCSRCGFVGLAVYEESRRGALNSELTHHRGYYVKSATLASIQKLITQCPEPKNPHCQCSTHKIFVHVNESSRWNWLDDIPRTGTFKLTLYDS